VHDLVVRERQDEALGPRVEPAHRQLVVVVAPMDRIAVQVLQRVVHPTHVPLVRKAEATFLE
jgi:hypothetical protein